MQKEEQILLNVQKSAAFLGVSTATIRLWAQRKKLVGVKVGSRGDWRFTKKELLKMIKVEKKKFIKIKKFLKLHAEEIHTIANKKHILHLGTDNVRIKKLEAHNKETIRVIKEFANNLEDINKGKDIFERLAKKIAKKSLYKGLTLEESVDGTIFLKQAFWEKLEEEGLLYELTTQDFYTFSNIITTYSDIVAAQIVFSYHEHFLKEQDNLLSVKKYAREQEKQLKTLVKFKKKMEGQQQNFLAGGGKMGTLMRSFDWSKTPAGPSKDWPQSLRTAISIVLNSSFPMFVWWGRDALTNFYNDSYSIILDKKHPQALGTSAQKVWKEIWNDVGPLAEKVFTTGKPIFMKNLPLIMNRRGYEEQTYFTFSYSPIRDETGKIGGIYCACVETTNEVMGKRRLQESEDRFKQYAEAMPQMSFIANAKGETIYYNQRWYEYLNGMKKTDGDTLGDKKIYHPDDLKRIITHWANSIQTGEPYEMEYRLKRNDGEYRWHLGRAIPMRDKDGNITQWFGTNTDIHEQKQLAQQKDDFIGIASHELKTPVTSLKAYAQVLQKTFQRKGDTQSVEHLTKMDNQINKLTHLIGDLLDVTKLQAGKFQFNKNYFDSTELLNEIIEEMQRTSDTHTIHATLLAESKVLYADRDRVGQVLINLISNAIKYSPTADRIIVGSKTTHEEVIFFVQDFGVGISKEKHAKLFQRFVRVNDVDTIPGIGLGLYISHEIITRQGGKIWFESTMGKGSTFFFSLPLAEEKSNR